MFRHIKFILLFLVTVNAIQAVDIPDSMQKVLDKSGGDNEKIKILLSASTTAHPDPELGSLYARMALNLSLKTNDRKSVAQSYYNIGANAYLNNTVKESHSNFLKASVIFDSLHDVGAMAKTYSALGDVLGDEGDSKKSIEYYNLAKSDFFMNRDTLNALYMDMSIAAILAMSGKFDSALAYSISSLPAARKFKNENLISKLLANIGGIYGAMGKNKEALDYFLQTLPYFEKKNTWSEKADAYTNISETYFKLKDYKNSKK